MGKGPHDDLEVRVAYSLFITPALTRYIAGVELLELRVSAVGEEWRLMLKGLRRGKHLVAFFYAPTWRDVFVHMTTMVDIGYVTWYDDIYPPKTVA